jgi:hypothetical protein
MPVSEDPVEATSIAIFGPGDNPSAGISYNLPLPGAYTFQRIVPIDIPSEDFTSGAGDAGIPLTALGVVEVTDGAISQVNADRLLAYYARTVAAGTRPSLRLAGTYGEDVLNPPVGTDSAQSQVPATATIDLRDDIEAQAARRNAYLVAASSQAAAEVQARINVAGGQLVTTIDLQVPGVGQSVRRVTYDVSQAGTPQIAIVETWQISSFLGTYGLGRTLQTFTLLPGEQTTITVDTWRTDAASREDSSSIFDSCDVASQDRFTSSLGTQADVATQDQSGWSASLGFQTSGSASYFGLISGSVSMNAGLAANGQDARQSFSSSVSSASREHAAQVNSSRNQAVSQNTTDTVQSGTSTSTVRTISNTNLRRVLNFVFRELNQEYQTVTALRGISLVFYNGQPGSAEIAPLYQLRDFIGKWIVADQAETVARAILALICQCVDDESNPQTMLQVGERQGGVYTWADAQLAVDGTIDFNGSVLGEDVSWRIKPGPIGQQNQADQVTGVVTARDTIVLRTDNVVGEALLGKADALDPYASALQSIDLQSRTADVNWRNSQVKRTTEALGIVGTLPEGDKVTGYKDMLVPPPEIQVVPVAAADANNNG